MKGVVEGEWLSGKESKSQSKSQVHKLPGKEKRLGIYSLWSLRYYSSVFPCPRRLDLRPLGEQPEIPCLRVHLDVVVFEYRSCWQSSLARRVS